MPIPRRAILAAMLAAAMPIASAAQEAGEVRPLVVLLEQDPWLMVIGSDSPRFALYDDGTVIYRTDAGYKWVKLDATERAALAARLDIGVLSCNAGYHALSAASDQKTENLILFGNDRRVVLSIYGSLDDGEVRSMLPPSLIDTYDALAHFDHPRARGWLPERIEVMLWPYPHAVEAPVAWPKRWPGLHDSGTIARHEDSYSVFLPSARRDELIAFLRSRKPRGAIEIEGRKWSAGIRYPFPGERLWSRFWDPQMPPSECGSGRR